MGKKLTTGSLLLLLIRKHIKSRIVIDESNVTISSRLNPRVLKCNFLHNSYTFTNDVNNLFGK